MRRNSISFFPYINKIKVCAKLSCVNLDVLDTLGHVLYLGWLWKLADLWMFQFKYPSLWSVNWLCPYAFVIMSIYAVKNRNKCSKGCQNIIHLSIEITLSRVKGCGCHQNFHAWALHCWACPFSEVWITPLNCLLPWLLKIWCFCLVCWI